MRLDFEIQMVHLLVFLKGKTWVRLSQSVVLLDIVMGDLMVSVMVSRSVEKTGEMKETSW